MGAADDILIRILVPAVTGLLTVVVSLMFYWMRLQDGADKKNSEEISLLKDLHNRDISMVKDDFARFRENVAVNYTTKDEMTRAESKLEEGIRDVDAKLDRILEILHTKADRN